MQYLKEEVRNRILDSARSEFERNGYRNASMRQIAQGAQMSLGNLYRYYINKEELFNALVEPTYEALMASLKDVAQTDTKTAASYKFKAAADEERYGIDLLVDRLLEICDENHSELFILLEKSQGVGNRYEHTKGDLIQLMDEILREKMLPELAAQGCVVESKHLARVLAEVFIEGLTSSLRYGNGPEIRLLMNQLINILFQDIAKRLST